MNNTCQVFYLYYTMRPPISHAAWLAWLLPAIASLCTEDSNSKSGVMFTSQSVEEYIASLSSIKRSEAATPAALLKELINSSVADLTSWAKSKTTKYTNEINDTLANDTQEADVYYNFIPRHVATLEHDSKWLNFEGRCFKDIKVRSTKQDNGTIKIEADYQNNISSTCAEYVLLGNAAAFHMEVKLISGKDNYVWSANNRSVYVLNLQKPLTSAIYGMNKTIELLFGTGDVVEFLDRFMRIKLHKRQQTDASDLANVDIHPGDAMVIAQINGESASIMWAAGSLASHTAIFLRDPGTKELYVVESTPTGGNGTRKSPAKEFLKNHSARYFNAVHISLKSELRDSFDNDAAWKKFVTEFEGYEYGYRNFLFSAVDTLKGNYPCLPMDNYQTCLSWELIEILTGLMERVTPEIANALLIEGLNNRLGTSGLPFIELLKLADSKLEGGAATLLSIPEQDEWTYHTYRNGTPAVGPSRVCSALVREMLRAGGVLGDHNISCSEFTPWDIYSMDIFNTTTQQLTGGYNIDLSQPPALRLSQKPVTDHMAEKCATIITSDSYYDRAPHC